jgi:hypothetical protein
MRVHSFRKYFHIGRPFAPPPFAKKEKNVVCLKFSKYLLQPKIYSRQEARRKKNIDCPPQQKILESEETKNMYLVHHSELLPPVSQFNIFSSFQWFLKRILRGRFIRIICMYILHPLNIFAKYFLVYFILLVVTTNDKRSIN